jgi:hypothetical protein
VSRKDLPIHYRGVQSGHAVAQWLLEHPKQDWNNHTLIFLEVENEFKLLRLLDKVKDKEDNFSTFHEPDIGNQLTAIACHTNSRVFSNLKLQGSTL